MTIGTKIFTWFNGRRVGEDPYGNVYYTERQTSRSARARRWVMYKGMTEPSKVPPLYHAWLHYTSNDFPDASQIKHYAWEKPHQPNLTGTKGAYLPPGHPKRGGRRDPSTSDYEPWTPK